MPFSPGKPRADLAMISPVGNDVGYEHVFVRLAQGKRDDGLSGISTSGRVDDCVAFAERLEVIFATFGDAMRVPCCAPTRLTGATGSLSSIRAWSSPTQAIAACLSGMTCRRATVLRRISCWDQRDFETRDKNAGEGAGALGMRWPHGIAFRDRRLLVSDVGNNRVMSWRHWSAANGEPCEFALGQADKQGLDHSRAAYHPTAGAMNMLYGLSLQDRTLVVGDMANAPLLGFGQNGLVERAKATRLAGQRDFSCKGDNRWGHARRDTLCWPYGVASCGTTLAIADSGNNRVLLWEAAP